jgi:RsiW-degrading membrane proteinase PrsW (M82 family)
MRRRALWLIFGIAGGALVLLGVGGGLLALALLLALRGALTAAEALPVAGLMAFGLGLGVPVALQGWAGWQGCPSRPFNPPRTCWMCLALVLLIGLGTIVTALSLAPALLLPPIHVLAMICPPLVVLWLVGRGLNGMGGSWRDVVAGMAGGGILGTTASLVCEGLIGFALIVVVLTVVQLLPGGAERISVLTRDFEDLAGRQDLAKLLELLLSPAVAISILGMFSVPVPLVEEFFKTMAAGVAFRWMRPRPGRAFLWGVAGGAGFALAENLFNGVLGGAQGWALGAMSRVAATTMHCFTGGLVGWGWGQLWTARRPLRLLGSYAVAVAIHGLWNAAAVGIALLGACTWVYEGDDGWIALAGLGILALAGLLGLLVGGFLFALRLAGRKLTVDDRH